MAKVSNPSRDVHRMNAKFEGREAERQSPHGEKRFAFWCRGHRKFDEKGVSMVKLGESRMGAFSNHELPCGIMLLE